MSTQTEEEQEIFGDPQEVGFVSGDSVSLCWPSGKVLCQGLVIEVSDFCVYLGIPQIGTRKFFKIGRWSKQPGIWWQAQARKQFGYSYYRIVKGV